jgi:deoxycytidylate deaminase
MSIKEINMWFLRGLENSPRVEMATRIPGAGRQVTRVMRTATRTRNISQCIDDIECRSDVQKGAPSEPKPDIKTKILPDYVLHPFYNGLRRNGIATSLRSGISWTNMEGLGLGPIHLRGKYIGGGKVQDTHAHVNAFVWKMRSGVSLKTGAEYVMLCPDTMMRENGVFLVVDQITTPEAFKGSSMSIREIYAEYAERCDKSS